MAGPMVRVRRYDQRPQITQGWFAEDEEGGYFASRHNPFYERQMRMQSWRRPL